MARANMKRAGIQHMNKKSGNGKSFFALNWRKFL
jgi:hypothetical protein